MYERYVKRALDIIISLAALIVLSPVMLIVALLIRMESPGPAIFRQKRIGRNGEVFEFLKNLLQGILGKKFKSILL